MSEKPHVKEADKERYSMKDMWWSNSKTAVAVFVVAGIYFRFLHTESTTKHISERIEDVMLLQRSENDKLIKYVNKEIIDINRRIDTKTDRNKNIIEENREDIKNLKLPNTDKE